MQTNNVPPALVEELERVVSEIERLVDERTSFRSKLEDVGISWWAYLAGLLLMVAAFVGLTWGIFELGTALGGP